MGSLSIWHWLIVLAVVMVLFGGGNKVSGLMADVARGLKAFKKTMAEEPDASMEASADHRPPGALAAPGASPGAGPAAKAPDSVPHG